MEGSTSLVKGKQPATSSTQPATHDSSPVRGQIRRIPLGKVERAVSWLRNGEQHWFIRVSAVAFSAIALVVAAAAADLPLGAVAVVAIPITIYAVIVWRRLAHQEAMAQQDDRPGANAAIGRRRRLAHQGETIQHLQPDSAGPSSPSVASAQQSGGSVEGKTMALDDDGDADDWEMSVVEDEEVAGTSTQHLQPDSAGPSSPSVASAQPSSGPVEGQARVSDDDGDADDWEMSVVEDEEVAGTSTQHLQPDSAGPSSPSVASAQPSSGPVEGQARVSDDDGDPDGWEIGKDEEVAGTSTQHLQPDSAGPSSPSGAPARQSDESLLDLGGDESLLEAAEDEELSALADQVVFSDSGNELPDLELSLETRKDEDFSETNGVSSGVVVGASGISEAEGDATAESKADASAAGEVNGHVVDAPIADEVEGNATAEGSASFSGASSSRPASPKRRNEAKPSMALSTPASKQSSLDAARSSIEGSLALEAMYEVVGGEDKFKELQEFSLTGKFESIKGSSLLHSIMSWNNRNLSNLPSILFKVVHKNALNKPFVMCLCMDKAMELLFFYCEENSHYTWNSELYNNRDHRADRRHLDELKEIIQGKNGQYVLYNPNQENSSQPRKKQRSQRALAERSQLNSASQPVAPATFRGRFSIFKSRGGKG